MLPKKLHVIWIGDESKRPNDWMQTWRDLHPDWEYIIWGNKEFEEHDWHNKKLIESYLSEGRYPAVADCMRYQILYEYGGFMQPADSICLNAIDELFEEPHEAYGVYENEKVRPGLISPLYGAKQGSAFAKALMLNLPEVAPKASDGRNKAPWQVTGNLYMKSMYERFGNDTIKIFPSHYFTPEHYTGEIYQGPDKIYAKQMWGTTKAWLASK